MSDNPNAEITSNP